MAQKTDIGKLLAGDGTSQNQRPLKALEPSYVKIDERDVQDFLVFALRLADRIVYHKHPGATRATSKASVSGAGSAQLIGGSGAANSAAAENAAGSAAVGGAASGAAEGGAASGAAPNPASTTYDWRPFFEQSPSVVIAAIQTTNPLPARQKVSAALAPPHTIQSLKDAFDGLWSIAASINQWERGLDAGSPLKAHVRRLIEANLSDVLSLLVSYEMKAVRRFKKRYPEGADTRSVAARCRTFGSTWRTQKVSTLKVQSDLFGGYKDDEDSIAEAKGRLDEPLAALYNTYAELIRVAPTYFDESVEKRSDHQPHIALFLAFLKLYLLVRDDANKLTQRHLDFYLKKVLGLTSKSAQPDHLHLVVTPSKKVFAARGFDEHKLAEGTPVDAGKDATGKELVYKLDEDIVVNLAQVEDLRTVFLDVATASTGERTVQGVYAAPIANSGNGSGGDFSDEDNPAWPTLGSTGAPNARIAFIIASDELALSEGTRTVTLTIALESMPDALTASGTALQDLFDVAFSGEKEWITPTIAGVTLSDAAGGLKFDLELNPSDLPVVAYDAKTLGEQYGTSKPVLKIALKDVQLGSAHAYQVMKDLTVSSIKLETTVDEIRAVVAQNDLAPLDPSKSFMPFGPAPSVGTGLYVGSAEAFRKHLTKLTLHVTWEDLPLDFKDHYKGYYKETEKDASDEFVKNFEREHTSEIVALFNEYYRGDREALQADSETGKHLDIYKSFYPGRFEKLYKQATAGQKLLPSRSDFTAKFSILNPRVSALNRKTETKELFPALTDETDVSTDEDSSEEEGYNSISLTNDDVDLTPPLTPSDLVEYGGQSKSGLLKIALERDFLHGDYAVVLARQALANALLPDTQIPDAVYVYPADDTADDTAGDTASPTYAIIPGEPYTPTVKDLYLSYESSVSSEASSSAIELIHVHPFKDSYEIKGAEKAHLFPQFRFEGALFVGVKNLEPLQSLSILFQVSEGTADAELEKPVVEWEYLSCNKWVGFEEYEVTSDTTNGLITSGIVTFAVPREIDKKNTVLPSSLHWIRATVQTNPGAVSDLIGIHAQAVRATFSDRGNDPNHLTSPLAAETVAGLVQDDAAIESVEQPYASFNGRPAESGLPFYTRVSERLRHKGRAITRFDYERLLLEEFPSIYKVKCINHANSSHEIAPGHVLMAVIPDFTKLLGADRRRPKVTLATLDEIKTFLLQVNSPFVQRGSAAPGRLHVVNPVYEEVRVAFKVKFHRKITAIEFHVRELRKAIVQFLSPWAYEKGADISFGGRVYKSTILNFVEEQSYVDYVTDFKMMHRGSGRDVQVIQVETPRSILVPAPEDGHNIQPITDETCTMSHGLRPEGVGSMTVSDDFQISHPQDAT